MRAELAVAMVALGALAGCDRQPAGGKNVDVKQPVREVTLPRQQVPTAPMRVLMGGPSEGINVDCTGQHFQAETISFVIDNKFLKKLGSAEQTFPRNIKRKKNGVESPDPNPPTIDKQHWATNMDFEVKQPPGNTDYVEISVLLAPEVQDGIDFLKVLDKYGIPDEKSTAFAITTETGKAAKFCIYPSFYDQGGARVVRFGAKLDHAETASFNIGLIAKDKKASKAAGRDLWVPLYVDPNIKNNG